MATAAETTYSKILKERDSVLSQIVAERERRFTTGTGDEDALVAARLALHGFRRDTMASKAAKIEEQQVIVGIYQKSYADLKTRAAAGSVGTEALLLANDALLQAQQMLEELRLGNGLPTSR